MAEIGLAAATWAEIGLRAMLDGDAPRAVGALASISEESWVALRERFPGFPAQLLEPGAPLTELVGAVERPSIES